MILEWLNLNIEISEPQTWKEMNPSSNKCNKQHHWAKNIKRNKHTCILHILFWYFVSCCLWQVMYTWLVLICLALPIKDYPEAGEMVADTGHCLTILGMTSILASCEIPSRILFIPVGADRIREQKSTAFHLSLKCIFTIRY